jgi:hypothetical protein
MSKYEENQPKPKHNMAYRFADWSTGFLKRRKDKEKAAQQARVMA